MTCLTNISHYGDILAIPFFALLIIYFYNIKKQNANRKDFIIIWYVWICIRHFIYIYFFVSSPIFNDLNHSIFHIYSIEDSLFNIFGILFPLLSIHAPHNLLNHLMPFTHKMFIY